MMYLSKEATNKDQGLKMQMMLSPDKEDPTNNSEKIWSSNGFSGHQRGGFIIKKANFNFESRRLCNLFGLCDIRAVNSSKQLSFI